MKKTATILIASLFVIGCSSNKLDRSKAEEIISAFYDYPNVEVINFKNSATLHEINNSLKEIRSKDLIYHQKSYSVGPFYDLFLTDKGNAYLADNPKKKYLMASNMREFNEITGIRISEGEKHATVDFNIIRTNTTVFGKFKKYKDGDIVNYSVKMALYDDGWRITNKKVKNYKKEDFNCFK